MFCMFTHSNSWLNLWFFNTCCVIVVWTSNFDKFLAIVETIHCMSVMSARYFPRVHCVAFFFAMLTNCWRYIGSFVAYAIITHSSILELSRYCQPHIFDDISEIDSAQILILFLHSSIFLLSVSISSKNHSSVTFHDRMSIINQVVIALVYFSQFFIQGVFAIVLRYRINL